MEKKLNILIVDGDVSEAEELENELNREFDIVGTVFDGMKAVDEKWNLTLHVCESARKSESSGKENGYV